MGLRCLKAHPQQRTTLHAPYWPQQNAITNKFLHIIVEDHRQRPGSTKDKAICGSTKDHFRQCNCAPHVCLAYSLKTGTSTLFAPYPALLNLGKLYIGDMRTPEFSRPSALSMLWYHSKTDQRHADLRASTIEECMARKRLKPLKQSQDEDHVRYLLAVLIVYDAERKVEIAHSLPRVHDPLPAMTFQETISLFYLADKLKIGDLYDLLLEIIEDWFWRAPEIWLCEYAWVFGPGLAVANTLRTRTNLLIPKAMAAHVVRKWRQGEPIRAVGRLMELASRNTEFVEALHEAWQFHIDLRLR